MGKNVLVYYANQKFNGCMYSHGIKNIQNLLTEAQRGDVYNWLSDVDPSPIHHRACRNHEPGTCDWISRLPEWAKFLDGKIRCLWIHGIPGAGKTVLASQLIGTLEGRCKTLSSGNSKSISIYYYCYFGNNHDETNSLLKWVLVRLCRQARQVPERLWKLFEHGSQPSTERLLSALESALEPFEHVFITIDAIDESKPRDELLKVIRDLVTDHRFDKIRLLVTSREYLDIETAMKDVSTEVSMRNEHLDADIRLYTESRLSSHEKIKKWSPELRSETLEALCAGAQGMFRWVVCQIDALRRVKETKAAIRNELRNLPKTLDEVYDRIFQAIPKEDAIVVRSAMRWICFNNKVYEGYDLHCLTLLGAVENDVSRDGTCTREYECDIDLLRELCGCLITVEMRLVHGRSDGLVEQQFVSFAHYTVLEYLASPSQYRPELFFALDKDKMLLNQAKVLLEQSQSFSIADADHFENQNLDDDRARRAPNFPTYCALSALMFISKHDDFLAERQDLASLVIALGPRESHFLDTLQRSIDLEALYTMGDQFHIPLNFADVTWNALPGPRVRTLVQLLLAGGLKLSHFFLEKGNAASILNSEIHLKVYSRLYCTLKSAELLEAWNFDGSLVDFFAMHCVTDSRIFEYLIESWAGAIDFRTVLVSYMPWHYHQDKCRDACVLQRVLDSGAPVDSEDYVYTPLQVAVACLDLEGVDILLRNGAKPNASGSTASGVPKYGHLIGLSTFLGGKSPLKICRSGLYKGISMEGWNYSLKYRLKRRFLDGEKTNSLIEKRLLESGAIASP
ncbi:hypothetical protein LY76DRAFT_597818 [Colletotrichum caudatum]|nr:hypothetical protein LY76DRAFT_597818 [Colletotrichum caudatum]